MCAAYFICPLRHLSRTTFLQETSRCVKLAAPFCRQSVRWQGGGVVGRTEAEMEHLEKNPYFTKYTQRLKKLQQESPEMFEEKLAALEAAKQAEQQQRAADAAEAKAQASAHVQSLSSVMNVELVRDREPDEVAEIWKLHHQNLDCVFAAIPANEYVEMQVKAKEFPNFLYPLPRGTGYEYFVQRWVGDTCHFTPLCVFQTMRENAPICLSLIHYTELVEEKGLVLMSGRPELNVLSVYEAQLLALQLKLYYGICAGLRFNVVRHFNNAPDTFRHEQLVREFETYRRDARDVREGTT